MDDDWDLHAVVRGCLPAVAAKSSPPASTSSRQDFSITSGNLEDPAATTSKQDLLHDLCKPFFFPKGASEMTKVGIREEQQQLQQPFSVVNLPPNKSTSGSQKSTPRGKKRKNSMKRVCQVASEEVSSDVWNWRKYGQKPIKGSPYPRGYYRCSTSKGCMARKQVERNKSEPGMFILTYTGDHNHPMPTHRASLAAAAAVSRQKPPDPNPISDDCDIKPASPEKLDDREVNDNDDFSPLDDDFFEGLEGFTVGERSADHSPVDFPWSPANGGAATGDGGGG